MGGLQGAHVLLVDDCVDALMPLAALLEMIGAEVDTADNGHTALQRLRQAHFDVLVSDLRMPGMSGVDLARQARRDQPSLEVLFASGYGDELTRHLEFPARSLQKPYDLDVLQDALQQIVQSVQAKAA